MNPTAKTIQIFLPGGDPRGIRVAEITTRIVQVIEVPRSLLQDFLKMQESDQVALYFLFGEAEDGSEQKVYLGQTGDLRARLVTHNKEKEFWQRALVLISRTNSLTQTHSSWNGTASKPPAKPPVTPTKTATTAPSLIPPHHSKRTVLRFLKRAKSYWPHSASHSSIRWGNPPQRRGRRRCFIAKLLVPTDGDSTRRRALWS